MTHYQLSKGKKKLKKISRRAQERVLQTLGTHTGTADPDFEATVHRVENLEKNLNNMFGAMNEYLKAMEAMQTASVNMATSFSLVIGEEHEELVRRQVANDESSDAEAEIEAEIEAEVDENEATSVSTSTASTFTSNSPTNDLSFDPNLISVFEEFVTETKVNHRTIYINGQII